MELLIAFIIGQLWMLYISELNRRFAVIDHIRASLPDKQSALADVQNRAAVLSESIHALTKPQPKPRTTRARQGNSSLRLQFAY